MTNTNGLIDEFQGNYRFLSNFYPARVVLDGVEYPTVEHAYQASKTMVDSEREHVRRAYSPGTAKRLGRNISRRSDWNEVKLSIMFGLVSQKFASNPVLAKRLLATGDVELIEGNTWGDRYWGVCRGVGENHLGKILMQVRHDLRLNGIPR